MMMLVTLTVRRDELESFRLFEDEAARIMAKHGGALERSIVLPTPPDQPHREVHVVSFPSEAAYAAYRANPELAAFLAHREKSVLKTEVVVGEAGPRYGA